MALAFKHVGAEGGLEDPEGLTKGMTGPIPRCVGPEQMRKLVPTDGLRSTSNVNQDPKGFPEGKMNELSRAPSDFRRPQKSELERHLNTSRRIGEPGRAPWS